ncbi:MAG: PaaX family transcriptional regulator C-terminal domain-containing protein [Rhodococcus sp. (in: high G+C Gram-positive bacteria)]|uniref:PaaX family transcriptional regulator n=1 Tax=Rhodococcus sp. TaxID=1831 RepID=UPI002ADAE524|nr:PaaX family transcriptional regulator C-terminal domain-containing protein [Rhodococcus sp. (in: high G+C Gram-positive bacteria)]
MTDVSKIDLAVSSAAGGTGTADWKQVDGPTKTSPQQLLLAFLGAFVLDHDDRTHVDTRVYVDVLAFLEINHTVVRTTLNRMARSGLLDRVRSGRTAAYGLTPRSNELLSRGRERVSSATPFTPREDTWTLLSYSVAESRRDIRHQLRSQLSWAGFGCLRDGLWIAPGAVDVDDIIAGIDGPDARAVAFVGSATAGLTPDEFVRDTWNLDRIRSEHREFIETWSTPTENSKPTYSKPVNSNPAAAYTALNSDWLRLLRNDPGLPADCLPVGWPALTSVQVYTSAVQRLSSSADEFVERTIAAYAGRK